MKMKTSKINSNCLSIDGFFKNKPTHIVTTFEGAKRVVKKECIAGDKIFNIDWADMNKTDVNKLKKYIPTVCRKTILGWRKDGRK